MNKRDDTADTKLAANDAGIGETPPNYRAARVSIVGIFIILLASVLYFSRDLMLPVVLAFLFTLVFSPIVRAFRRRGLPEPVTAVILVSVFAAVIAVGSYTLSAPVAQWINDAPRIGVQLRGKLSGLIEPVRKLRQAEEQVSDATGQSSKSGVQEVIVREPGLLSQAARSAPNLFASISLTLVLLMFLLASGDLYYVKLVRVLPTLTDRKRGLRIARDIEREVSRYLLTITAINIGFGVVIATVFYWVGTPNPVLWGVAAAALNFIPYLGAVIGMAMVTAVSILSFPSLGEALFAPATYLACTALEGQFITPALVGRRMQVNAVSVLLAVAFWGFMWGIAGIFIAVPVLIVIRVFSCHIEGLNGLYEFLGPRDQDPQAPDG
jgi:predicted PurR-regulated permease PerM